ncbi:hypothetical protein V2G26_020276 [Clonostachys chloroleuca]
MTPPKGEEDPLPCPSWIVSNGTNIHLAEDRSWFADDYMPVESFVEISFGGTLPVIGMCTVNLPIKVAANKTGPTSHGTMRLENVLNVPSILCNIIGAPVYDEYAYSVRSRAFTDPATGRQVAYCKPDTKLCEIQLSGPPIGTEVGPSSIDPSPSVIHVIGAFWPESKQTRIATEIKRKDDMKSTSSGFFGDNEDSELARSVLRNFMLRKRPTLEDDDENNEGEDEGDSSTDEMNLFLTSIYEDEDCKAQAIANAFENAFFMDDSDDSDADLADSEHSYQEPMLETNYIFFSKASSMAGEQIRLNPKFLAHSKAQTRFWVRLR